MEIRRKMQDIVVKAKIVPLLPAPVVAGWLVVRVKVLNVLVISAPVAAGWLVDVMLAVMLYSWWWRCKEE